MRLEYNSSKNSLYRSMDVPGAVLCRAQHPSMNKNPELRVPRWTGISSTVSLDEQESHFWHQCEDRRGFLIWNHAAWAAKSHYSFLYWDSWVQGKVCATMCISLGKGDGYVWGLPRKPYAECVLCRPGEPSCVKLRVGLTIQLNNQWAVFIDREKSQVPQIHKTLRPSENMTGPH